ncbi:Leucine-rich repeat receptor-like serine/threonine-protein kinase BAM1 [Acorus calamus]|uniref:Leucine-rich repeat receptor-like serine/threonine-protein kinase BAM1 n=1 Tax=Acorus calamus TaxID=4465 RepID=A0AAV9ETL2_ACOCL|nr:Leucine-rich repeat receptor-like serine/threonine-protein kinase BAM1 [Acorus calamus]
MQSLTAFSYFNATSFVGNPNLCGPYLGPCKPGSVSASSEGTAHLKGPLTASF